MSKVLTDVKIGIDDVIEEKLELLVPQFADYRIIKQSVDARQRHSPHFVMTIEVAEKGEKLSKTSFQFDKITYKGPKPIIIGSGPAGLFCALRLIERGIPCLLFEQGSQSTERIKAINRYWRYGVLDPKNNVCFGEGGAGLYSDGKLITRIKSEHIPYVMRRLVEFGAPEEIEFMSNPHVGSDRIRRVIPTLRDHLIKNGCEIHFDTKITEILFNDKNITGVKTEKGELYSSDFVVLATGHSAEDIIYHLAEKGVAIEGKSFAMGLRIEHSQKLINQIQFREFADHPKLGAANYKLAYTDKKTNIGVYSFCMCPGGYILSSGTDADRLVSNGMSNYKRNSPFANAAMVVTVNFESLFKKEDIFAGLKFRQDLESKAFSEVQKNQGGHALPAQNLMDFLEGKATQKMGPTSCPSGGSAVRLDQLLPKFMTENLRDGIEKFNKNMRGFINPDSQLFGVESRTSCPIRIPRDARSLESTSHQGLYPAGEGAGYAGGITSAACDGINIAEVIFAKVASQAQSYKSNS